MDTLTGCFVPRPNTSSTAWVPKAACNETKPDRPGG